MEEMVERILAMAAADANILAVVVTGSRAAVHGRPDEWSDLDVELICGDPSPLADDDGWLQGLGRVLACLPSTAEDGAHQTRLVVYPDGEVDFSLCGRDRITGQADGLCDLYRRGYRVLFDREGLTAALPEPDGGHPRHRLPTEEEFDRAVTVFWLEAHHLPGYLARGDLWAAKFRDGTMKRHLRTMLEWRAVLRDPDADVRHIGHHMAEWLDPETWEDLRVVWGGFDAPAQREATLATAAVFGRAAREVADALGYDYPEGAERAVMERFGR